MTVCEGSRSQAAGLVLLAVGSPTEVPDRVDAAARRLQALSGWPLRALAGGQPPARQLAGLGEGRDTSRPPAWIAPLPVDPGLTLSEGDCWAEALGAWRQPAALLLEAPQLGTGWPAAATALLRQARVPLAGLIQIGGDWEPERRRCEGLPWLGWLADGSAPASGAPAGDTASATRGERAGEEPELLVALIRRWSGLDLL